MIRQKIFNIFKKLNLDNPLEFARRILAPLCKDKLSEHITNCKECRTCKNCDKKLPWGNPDANILIINDNATDNEEINDYIKCVNDYYKITKVEKLKLELNTETDPMKQAKILTEIMKIRGVNNND